MTLILGVCSLAQRETARKQIVLISEGARTPGFKLTLAVIVGLVLTVPLFSVWLLVYDRKTQSEEATASITEGWGAAQVINGPVLVIPYRVSTTETVVANGQNLSRTVPVTRELTLAPEAVDLATSVRPELRRRSIYEAVVYDAALSATARFALPSDFARIGVDRSQLDLSRAELRFGVSDPRGLGANGRVTANAQPLPLQPSGRGFTAPVDASALGPSAIKVDFSYELRGSQSLSLTPAAGDTHWTVRSSWPSPSFAGDFLPGARHVGSNGFDASYRIGNLAIGRSLVSTSDSALATAPERTSASTSNPPLPSAEISLIQPIDAYSQVNRATKYGFLFIGFTFLALLMFDVIGGVPVSGVAYLLMGAALVLFFVLLLAFAEVIGFTPAYVAASAAVAGLNTAYAAAVLGSWRRAAFIGGLLAGLYCVLYVLLSLEAFSLLIGSLLLFGALAGVMYATRRIDWGAPRTPAVA
jgi:inner membrane protein